MTAEILRTVDTLIFALFVHIVEVPEHLYRTDMASSIVHDPLTAVFHEILEQLEGLGMISMLSAKTTGAHLVYLSPLASFLFHIPSIDTRHDFVELLAAQV